MNVKQMIAMLNHFDPDHAIEMEIVTECGHLVVGANVQDISYEKGRVVLKGDDCL